MNTYIDDLLNRFRSKGALIDANLLLLLLVGSYDRSLLGVEGFKRVQKYTLEDYALLVSLLEQFKMSVTTPHILTEVSNLAGQLAENHKTACFKRFGEMFRAFSELNDPSLKATLRPEFPYLGLTDCVIADAAADYLVITDDLRFFASLERAGLEALNFNHIRSLAWL